MEKLFKTLGDQNRLRIINLLTHDQFCVCELEVILQTTQSNVSRHLSRLRNEGIITYHKKAQWVYYSLSKSFEGEHPLLFQYLKHRMAQDQIFLDDTQRLECYKASGENCETLKDKENVIFAS
ncbi:MAG: metalloregulator ArsR/SmtB family transcription factor [Bacillota bacterium]|nr:metalloregulator ArsR/SmtB family transcription factor [Bacillota bacterium]MDW7676783.1 metalloregulator ArsR/SmtB family transcription factor [Bacillota bacterium]